MSTHTTVSASERSEFTQRLMGLRSILPTPRRAPATLRASEHYAAVISQHSAEVADDLAAALGSTHRLPVSFHEIAKRDTETPETAAPRHRKAGAPCSDVTRSRRHRTTPFRAYLGAR